jgi:hypothetical protein
VADETIEVGEPRRVVIVPLTIDGTLYEVEASASLTDDDAARAVFDEAVKQATARAKQPRSRLRAGTIRDPDRAALPRQYLLPMP